jgi:hypothetical protein
VNEATPRRSLSTHDESSTAARKRPGDEVMSYSLTDLRLSLEGTGWIGKDSTMKISAWVRNVFDKQ